MAHSLVSEDDKSFSLNDGEKDFLVAKGALGKDAQDKIRGLPKFAAPVAGPVAPEPTILDKVDSALSLPGEQEQLALQKWEQGRAADVARAPAAESAPIAVQEAVPVPVPVPAPATPQQASMLQQYEQAQNQRIGAINAEAKAQEQLAKDQEGVYGSLYSQKQEEQQRARLAELQTKEKELDQENDKLFKAAQENKIDPDRAWNNKSTGNKILAVFSILLGGAGSGGRAENNAAMRVIQNSIDNDIKAQMEDSANTKSLYQMNLQKYRDNLTAQQATQLQLTAMAQGKLAGLTAKYNSTAANAKAQGLIGEMNQKYLTDKQEFMTTIAKTQNIADQDPVLFKISQLPKQYQDAAVKELGEYEKIKANLELVPKILKKSYAGAGVKNRVFSPIEAEQKRKTAKAELVPIVKSILGEAINVSDIETMVDPFLANAFSGQMSEKKFMESTSGLLTMLRTKAGASTPILSRAGIISPIQPEEEIKTVGGIKYKRGPNGEAIKVK